MQDTERLTRIIAKTGMSRLQIAVYLGVSERTVYRWIAGDTHIPRMVFIALELLLEEN